MPRPSMRSIVLGFAVVAISVSTACSATGPLVSDLQLSSAVVAPSGFRDTPPIDVGYSLSRPATISAYLVSGSGEKLYIWKDEQRPVAGEYVLTVTGAYSPIPGGSERRVLPSGDYGLVLEARDGAGVQQQSRAQLRIQDADTNPPRVEKLAAFPEALSPNFDGVEDTTKITYRTTKTATVTIYLLSESGKSYVLEREERQPPGEHATTWDGQIINQLLPSGSYRLVVEARDSAGNVALAECALRLDSSSMPDAHLLAVDFEPQRVVFGDLVKVQMRVKNTGNTVLTSQGPDPGYVYGSQEGFSTIEGGAFRDRRGLWRVGVDWAGGPGASGSKYPYRWGFGKDLQPGEEVTVVGYIRLNERYPRIWLHAGLVQEQVRYWDNEVGRTVIEIGY